MPLPRSSPSDVGIDARGVLAFLDRVSAAGLELHSLMIARHGRVAVEGCWAPYQRGGIHLDYSLSKNFTATAVGMLVDAGRLRQDDLVLDYFPWLDPAGIAPAYRRLRIRDCLAMRTGHLDDAWDLAVAHLDRANPIGDPLVRAIFSVPPEREPGSIFAYNQIAFYLLSAVVSTIAPEGLLGLIRTGFIEPFGLGETQWSRSPGGVELGFDGLAVTTEAVLALGQLHLEKGVLQDRRVLSTGWVEEATANAGPWSALPDAAPFWNQGYGLSFWQWEAGFRGVGAYGQHLIVVPEQDAVIAITSESSGTLELIADTLLPALGAVGTPADEAQLSDRLVRLSIPPLASGGQGQGPDSAWWRVRGIPDLEPGEDVISVRRHGPGWELAGSVTGEPLRLLVGDGSWARSELILRGRRLSVVASGGWSEEEFAADLRIIESPHMITLTARGEVADLRWRQPPLAGSDPLVVAGWPA